MIADQTQPAQTGLPQRKTTTKQPAGISHAQTNRLTNTAKAESDKQMLHSRSQSLSSLKQQTTFRLRRSENARSLYFANAKTQELISHSRKPLHPLISQTSKSPLRTRGQTAATNLAPYQQNKISTYCSKVTNDTRTHETRTRG